MTILWASAWLVWANASDFATVSQEHMATRIDVTVPSEQVAATDHVFRAFSDVENSANEWRSGSPLARVNASAGVAPVEVPVAVYDLVKTGLAIGKISNGTFDVSWAAMWGVWDFRTPKPPPDAAVLAKQVALVGYEQIVLNEEKRTIYLPKKGMKLGVGGIAKGHALNLGANALRNAGVSDFTISAGGQVYAGGVKDGRKWRVGIRDPRGSPQDYFALVEVSDQSVSTSGDYERFFEHDGVRYHHILDPRTGQPARGLRSATVISADATLADALSTAVMVLGRDAGLRLIQSLEEVEAAVVDHNGKVFTSTGLDLLMVRPPQN